MYKLLIADDEQIVLDSLKHIVEKNLSEVVIETARSGREAIEKAEVFMPDIVFMDIRMPGINGIDAIREIKSRNKNCIFIILTAFEQFEFAKEAVNLGVSEYLLKPVNRFKVIETIKKSMENIKIKKEERKRALELRERLESVIPVLENGFIYSIIFFEDNSRELENYSKIFDMTENAGYVMTLEFGEVEGRGSLSNKIGVSVRSQSFYPFIRNTIKSRIKCMVGPVMLNRIVIFVPSEQHKDEYTHRIDAVSIAEDILDKLPEKLNADFKIGIGKCYRSFDNLARSYEESLKALRYARGKGVMHIMDVSVEEGEGDEYPVYKERIMLEKASLGYIEECVEAFNFIFNWLVIQYSRQPLKVKNKLLELIFLLERIAGDNGLEVSEFSKQRGYLEEMLSIEELTQLKAWCRAKVVDTTSLIKAARQKKINCLVQKAKEYIDIYYMREITLEDVSREVNISPQYFSKLFKEEMGENFIDYLTSTRIEKARELLEKGNHSVKEICFMIGYGDPNYFSRIFKKIVGVTPTEYKDTQNKG